MRLQMPKLTVYTETDDQLERITKQADEITDYVVVNGQLVPKSQANSVSADKKIDMPKKPVYTETDDQLERITKQADEITDYVVVNGQLVPKSQANSVSADKKIDMPKKPVYYWYDKDEKGRALYKFELQCLEKFKKSYNNPAFNYKAQIRSDGRLEVLIAMPFKPSEKIGWEIWKFQMLFDHDHPTMTRENTTFGGSIKVYPISPNVDGFHHLVRGENGRTYVCQVEEEMAAEVNSYAALQNVIRWLTVYYIWKQTGKDIDRK